MAKDTFPIRPTASSLKEELTESLTQLQRDFEKLKHFVTEIAPEGVPASIILSKADLDELVGSTLEVHDAADNIVFEASIIKDKLERLCR